MVKVVNMGCCILPNANIEATRNPWEVRDLGNLINLSILMEYRLKI
jgi:hypothetical protein